MLYLIMRLLICKHLYVLLGSRLDKRRLILWVRIRLRLRLREGLVNESVMRSDYVVMQQVVAAVGEELPFDSDIVGTKEIDRVKMVETVPMSVA
ncbi:hypothetical protein TanjilG_12178 [Lupinus angustifolius]|uniref:Uncharacterized protein n=1 Tax=Lupinus angustifolius TaxID=3871 RepID=A0A1J7GCK9_LUPAN|nr:hypothetical protein TanjilG_12178 [Lupinus angustifolius]